MTPRNESIRRSITTGATFLGTLALSSGPIDIPLIDAIIIYYSVPRSGLPPDVCRSKRIRFLRGSSVTPPRIKMISMVPAAWHTYAAASCLPRAQDIKLSHEGSESRLAITTPFLSRDLTNQRSRHRRFPVVSRCC
ncbi:hypothetical protein KM043_002646 [Ampulex compressa]|nr:hypothetical protein KM043_002646 [Ampulex compressa]